MCKNNKQPMFSTKRRMSSQQQPQPQQQQPQSLFGLASSTSQPMQQPQAHFISPTTSQGNQPSATNNTTTEAATQPTTQRKPIRELLRVRRNTGEPSASNTGPGTDSNTLAFRDDVIHVGGIGWSVFGQGWNKQPAEQFKDLRADHKRKVINSIRSAENQDVDRDARYNLPHNFVSPINKGDTAQSRYALRRSQAAASSVQEIAAAERTALDSSRLEQSQLGSSSESPVRRIKRQQEEAEQQRRSQSQREAERTGMPPVEESGKETVVQEGLDLHRNPTSSSIRFRVDWKAENYLLWAELPCEESTIGYLKLWIFCLLFRHRRPELREYTMDEQLRATPSAMTQFMEILTEDGHRFTRRDENESVSVLGEKGSTTCITIIHDEDEVRSVYERYVRDGSQSSHRSVPRDKVLKFFRRTIARDVVDGMMERGFGTSSSSLPDVDLDNRRRQTLDEAVLPSFPDPEKGYILHPSEDTIRSMSSESELAAIKDFCITRTGHGSILWLGTTDIRRIDLANIVGIELGNVNVTVDTNQMPAGTGINKLAHVTLFNVWPSRLYPQHHEALRHFQTEEDRRLGRGRVPLSTRTNEEKQELDEFYFLLRRAVATEMGGHFVHYDLETGSLSFQLPYFQS
eukprot:gb/GECG01015342.1/.p1 GENE.gb/GECG01015342.1/~~gb/GECG01015342.1/.p1  ORF type:complete len:630 (+),score=84.56 gb/GECG01015342.1/:1-1890(+)